MPRCAKGSLIGSECIVGRNVYIDFGVQIGSRVKIQNNVSVYHGVTIEDGVFVGPHVCFTNDVLPRAITPEGTLKGTEDWVVTPIVIRYGASLGANADHRAWRVGWLVCSRRVWRGRHPLGARPGAGLRQSRATAWICLPLWPEVGRRWPRRQRPFARPCPVCQLTICCQARMSGTRYCLAWYDRSREVMRVGRKRHDSGCAPIAGC